MVLPLIMMMSCSKDSPGPNPNPTPVPVDVCPNMPGTQTDPAMCPPIPNPTGTVTTNFTSIPYNGSVEFNFKFYNTSAGFIGGVNVGKDSGTYVVSNLKNTTTFTISLTGTNGSTVNLAPILITVGQDPRINFITQGMFENDYTLCRPLTGDTAWTNTPNGTVNNYTYFWQGFTGPPGNNATATNNGSPINFFWWLTESGINHHGVNCDQFVIISPTTFKTHDYSPVIIGGIPVPGEYWRFFKRK